MTNDVTVARIRRRLETINLQPPSREVLEEIVAFIDDSKTYYSVKQHEEIVDRKVAEATNGDLDAEIYDRGYRSALDDIKDLRSHETPSNSGDAA